MEDVCFFLARSGVMVWSPDIFTYVDDGKQGASVISVTTVPMDGLVIYGQFTPHMAGKRIVQAF